MSELQSFENFIMKCCELDEWDLRTFLKEKLSEANFTTQEDDYSSYRGGRYQEVHNMLAIRGKSPKICLVAHTDVVRDMRSYSNQKKVQPVIKEINHYGNNTRIIQDKDCKTQIGGDDRLGVAINTWIALNTGYDMGLLFTTDEEAGNQSADYVDFKELRNFELVMQVDRGNVNRQLVTSIGGVRLCSNEVSSRLLNIAEQIGLPRSPIMGLMTDVLSLKSDGKIKNAVNMTCGYHNNHSRSEYINIQEAKDTMKFVSSIIQDYEMDTINEMENREITEEEVIADMAATEADMRINDDDGIVWN